MFTEIIETELVVVDDATLADVGGGTAVNFS